MSTLSWSLGPDGVLEIFGPVGIRRYVRENIRLTAVDLPYRCVATGSLGGMGLR
jgi:hypothetical protein